MKTEAGHRNSGFEFGVEKPPIARPDGTSELAERVLRGPIQRNDVFTRVRKVEKRIEGPYILQEESGSSLEILSIRANGRTFEEIDEGMTCLLGVSGPASSFDRQTILP